MEKKPAAKCRLSTICKNKRGAWGKQNNHTHWNAYMLSAEVAGDMCSKSYGQSVNVGEKVTNKKTKYSSKLHCWPAASMRIYYTLHIFTGNTTVNVYLFIL
jgi:hypothetical protein